MKATKVVSLVVLVLAAGVRARAQEEVGVYGRVRITKANEQADARYHAVLVALQASLSSAPGKEYPDRRIISLRTKEGDPSQFEATIYDYDLEKGFDLVLDAKGREIGRRVLPTQPDMSLEELHDAMEVVTRKSTWAEGIAGGTHHVYAPMPPIRTDEAGRRLINVGVMARPEGSWNASENEIVSVHIPTGEVLRNEGGAPPTSLAALAVCGPGSQSCGGSAGTCGTLFHFEWPASDPVWKFDAMHPSCTQSVQPQGTGLELQNVKYRDRLVLKRADMPVLNVLYAGNTCGPYRDWLYSENCFQVSGPLIGSGFVLASGTPGPTTFCETGIDAGNFKGVAIRDEGSSLWLLTETDAGWYRYVMEWRLGLDGTIEPIFGFGAVENGCTCNTHTHHGYWRLEFAIDGNEGDYTTGINILERRIPGGWTPVTQETSFSRPAATPTTDLLRIRNPQTGNLYTLYPGEQDGSAEGDIYAKADAWALAYNPGEINDPNGASTAINIAPWVNGEALGGSKRLVLWYRAGYMHDYNGGDLEPCELVGPRLVFRQPCQGLITLMRGSFGCSDSVPIELEDSDLANAGTATVTVRSTSESAGETVTLTESPAGSGRFQGALPTTTAPIAAGDGMLSVADGDSISIDYLDASSCGAPNVSVTEAASVDCTPPAISNVQVTNITDSSATVSWTTNEAANSRVLYGPATPPTTPQDDLTAYRTTHSVTLTGLTACSNLYFEVTSADVAGNSTTESNGGGYYSFTANGRGFALGPDDVEGGLGSWTASGPAGTVWHTGTCRSASPSHAWKAGSSSSCPGTYGNSADAYLTSAAFPLGAAGHGYHLRFREYYNTESSLDLCRPQVSTDGGASWTSLGQYSGSSGSWLVQDYDLSAFTGSVQIRFWFHSNSGTVNEGWYVDDVDISRSAVCGASLRRQSHLVTESCVGGGGNGVLDPGEDVVLQVNATNVGLADATNVSAMLTTTTPGVTITGGTTTFPHIPANGAGASDPPHFSFTLGTGVACSTSVDLALHFVSDQGAWSDALQLSLGSGGPANHVFPSTDTPRAIPDAATVTSDINVLGAGTVSDVNVTLSITHPHDGDLNLWLIGPQGTRVELSTGNGGSGDDYTSTTFDDAAAPAITSGSPPFTGSFRPEGSMSALNGIQANGTWRLEIMDGQPVNAGNLVSWSLAFDSDDPPSCTPCNVSTPGDVVSLSWTPGGTDSLDWSATPDARWYNLYRGEPAGLAALLDPTVDSCRRWSGTEPTTGGILGEAPSTDSFFWYLATAANAGGEGPPGSGTSGPRVVNDSGVCP